MKRLEHVPSIPCTNCGKSLSRKQAINFLGNQRRRGDERPFCSNSCLGVHRRLDIRGVPPCAKCGKSLTRKQASIWLQNTRRGYKRAFCSQECAFGLRDKENHPNWQGGRYTTTEKGYIFRSIGGGKRRPEHVLIAERIMGTSLPKGAVVHHIDANKKNNARSNLLVCSVSYHTWLHSRMSDLYAKEHFGK